ncbi:hypothetical protein [Embleya sp. NPDC059237]|uniref:hypothetical protein n=1 Tax=Embleya sp. NPDC059237 TaxID=3346784 RepID=UPI0036AF7203
MWSALDLVDAAVRTGRRDAAARHVATARAARLEDVSSRRRMLPLACGALLAEEDRHDGFEEALAVEGAGRRPFDQAASSCTTANGCGAPRLWPRHAGDSPPRRPSGAWARTCGPTARTRNCAPAAAGYPPPPCRMPP